METKLYVLLAQIIQAYHRCIGTQNDEWAAKHRERLETLVHEHMPSGAGIDREVKLNLKESTEEKLVFYTSYHHMNEVGMYDGWTDHVIRVRPSLCYGIVLSISGRDRNDIKDYLHEVFHEALTKEIED